MAEYMKIIIAGAGRSGLAAAGQLQRRARPDLLVWSTPGRDLVEP